MKEYIIAYFTAPNKCGNLHCQALTKKGALNCFRKQNKENIILNIIEL